MVIRVTLSHSQLHYAYQTGLYRHMRSLEKGHRPDWQDGTEVCNHMHGAACECAWHKWLGIFWHAPVDEFKAQDAVGGIQIRSSPQRKPFWKVKPSDPDDQTAVFFASGELTHYIVGYIPIIEAKRFPLVDPGGRNVYCHQVKREQMYTDFASLRETVLAKHKMMESVSI